MQISFLDWEDSTLARRAATAMESDEVRVVLASMPADEVALRAWDGLLSPDERARAEQFRVRESRCQFVFGRALLRQLLGSCLNIEPSALAFSYQPRGKPFLSQSGLRDDLRFNLSHSGRMVAVALARGRAVGVDTIGKAWLAITSVTAIARKPSSAGRCFGRLIGANTAC